MTDLFVPAEFLQATSCKVKDGKDVVDLSDEESPRFKEIFLSIINNGTMIKEQASGQIVATLGQDSISVNSASGGLIVLPIKNDMLHSQLGSLQVSPSPPSGCLCIGSKNVGAYDIYMTDGHQVAQCYSTSANTKSFMIDFYGDSAKAKLLAFLLVAHRLQFL